MTRAPPLEIDVIVECDRWPSDADQIVHRAIAQAMQVAKPKLTGRVLAVLLADDAVVRGLNVEWRGIDKPTNVLSFPAPNARASGPLGDIAIAYETTAREAKAERKPLVHHLSHLAVHGFLHLLGHDHASDAQAEEMEALERDILGGLGIPDPYLTHKNPSEEARA